MSVRKELLEHYGMGTQHVLYDDVEDKTYIHEVWDCEPIIEAAKRLSEMNPSKEFRHAAFIPPHVLNQAFREGSFNDREWWKKWANDPDNKMFRTWPGKL